MSKFKIGDRVRVLGVSHGFTWASLKKGDKGTVSRVDGDGIIRIKTDCGTYDGWGSHEDCFELLSPPKRHPFDMERALKGEPVVMRNGVVIDSITKRGGIGSTWILKVEAREFSSYEPYFKKDGRFLQSGEDSEYDLFMVKPPKEAVFAIGDRIQSKVSLNTGRPVVNGVYGVVKKLLSDETISVQLDTESKCRFVKKKDVTLIEMAEKPSVKEVTESLTGKKQQTVKQEVKKEIMATTPATTSKATAIINKNKAAAITAARIEAGSIAVNRITNMIKPKLPMMMRGYAETPVARVVVANLFSLAVQQYAADNKKAQLVADAMMEGAMLEMVKSFNIDALLGEVLKGVDFTKLSVEETE